MMWMKRLLAGMAAALLAAILFFSSEVMAISAQKAILVDAQTGRVLYEKNADSRGLIASTTKIMTALVICEQCNVLDRVKIPKEAVGIEGSSMYLKENEVLTVQELLYGLMLRSGNDAAVALAIYCGGTVEGFAELMNDKARRLGLYNTHFENPNGLDSPGHYSSARDLAKLTAYAMENPIFRKTVSTKSIQISERSLQNHNKLLWSLDGADGVKTGFTKAAGRILVSSAVREGRRLVAVTMNAPDDWKDHTELINRGFSEYKVVPLLNKGETLGRIEVVGGEEKTVSLLAATDFSYSLSACESVDIVFGGTEFVYAPVSAGQSAGCAYVRIDGKPVAAIPIVYADTIERESVQKRSIWQRLLGEVER